MRDDPRAIVFLAVILQIADDFVVMIRQLQTRVTIRVRILVGIESEGRSRRDIDRRRFLEKQFLARFLPSRSEEHTSELQSPCNLVCRLLLEKKKKKKE